MGAHLQPNSQHSTSVLESPAYKPNPNPTNPKINSTRHNPI